MRSRPVPRLLGALAAAGAVVCVVAVACEPQDIYLFDEASAGLEGEDAGADEPEPLPSAPDADAPVRQQPACQSSACEQCVERDDCGVAATLFCHPVTGDCELPCDPDAPRERRACTGTDQCDPSIGLCVECVRDDDCSYGPREVCNLARGQCAECVTSSDCPIDQPLCDPYARCVECLGDADCAVTNEVCQPGAQICVQCLDNSDCRFSDDDLLCLTGQQRCVECLEDADCTDDPRKPFCSSENECEDERE